MLRLFARRMRLAPGVDLAAIAARTEGRSGADLRGLCTAAGRNALLRIVDAGDREPRIVAADDFARALGEARIGDSGNEVLNSPPAPGYL